MAYEFIFGSAALALLFAVISGVYVLRQDRGTPRMIEISKAIQEGATAFLQRQYRTISIFAIIIAIILGVVLGVTAAVSFIAGAVLSALAGFIGMHISIRANVRTAKAAEKGISHALSTAFRGGAVTGFAVVGLGLIGVTGLYMIYGDVNTIIGFGFGASLVSLFARVGGGIFTKAADVGADIVGKVEKGIPEDDPRNPAVIADNVGDNVGDCAGMGADLFESYVVTLLAAMLLGALAGGALLLLPLTIAGVGIIASIGGIFFVRASSEREIWSAFNKGIIISAALAIVGTLAVTMYMPNGVNLFLATTSGIITAVIISIVTDYYTSMSKKPVQEIAKASETGAGTNVITGLAVGFQSTFIPVIVICLATLASFYLAGIYGIGLAALGLLSITGMIMSIDSFGPISDNAGGIAEMSNMNKKVRKVTDALDAVGNTTKATTKGVAIASAALSALALFAAFADVSGIVTIDILDVRVLVGLLIGGAIPFLFSAFIMKAVGKAAGSIVIEVRRQFRTLKIMSGKQKPDYGKCVDIAAKSALHELIAPALLAVLAPIIVGFVLGPTALAGLLAGSIVSGLMLAITLANAGGAWDNAKKYIEKGAFGGKGSDAHKAAVIGDTVGDPAKDSAGPSINSLIKVMNTLAILMAPFLVAYALA